ncbi:hypothetical protein MUB24_04925 [Lederbergia sp. NSJ-179]|uniref:hypothetical protein n=1 Tax=Lederbergia sp. NSJ-179 TaxID=2931402 RepID=UPI001FD188F9|nr:hypothetical protein [Lederbergia sp. NSJ-179]MCJ7840266.1 hypothetical protein [Lederbergia sp. NSJ-179]
MLKLKTLVMAVCFSLIGSGTITVTVSAHEPAQFKMEEAEFQSLLEKGYSEKDIFHAKGIAHLAKKDVEDVLKYYKKSGSWEKTAAHFGIDLEKMKAKHEKMKKFYLENQEEILAYIAEYSDTSLEDLKKLQEGNSFKIHHLMKAAVIAKLSNSAMIDIVNDHKAGKNFYEMAQDRNVQKEEFRKEMKRIHRELKRRVSS